MVEAYAQLDLNVSYDVADYLQVFFEGLNLTSENRRSYARSPRQLWNMEQAIKLEPAIPSKLNQSYFPKALLGC